MKQNASQQIRDIYKLDHQLSRIWNLIKKEMSQENIEMLDRYDTEMVNQSLGKSTRLKHLKILLSISRKLNKDWSVVSKDDISKLVKEIMNQYGDVNGAETESSRDFKKILKLFFRWYKLGSRNFNEVGDPDEIKAIKLRKPRDKLTRENLLNEDDRTRLLHACGENLRDRAFLDVHYEAGTRPGEILSLQLKHVEFDDYGARIRVDGKTGARPIRLVKSTPNLASWVNSHPFRENSESPLWILLDNDNYGRPMTYAAAKEMLFRRCRAAHLSKRVNLKLFRHSEATNTAKFLTDSEMRKRHGWTNDSSMTSKYVHLVDSDVEEKILAHYGIAIKNDQKPSNMPKVCGICKMPNSSESDRCSQCGKPLDLKKAIEIEEEKFERRNSEIDSMKLQISELTTKLSQKDEQWRNDLFHLFEEFENKLKDPEYRKAIPETN